MLDESQTREEDRYEESEKVYRKKGAVASYKMSEFHNINVTEHLSTESLHNAQTNVLRNIDI